jgi:ankyrin repeat protein
MMEFTHIHRLTVFGSVEELSTSLEADASLIDNYDADARTALIIAVEMGDVSRVSILLAAGANPNILHLIKQRMTPLMLAAAENKNAVKVMKALLAGGANIDANSGVIFLFLK